MNQAYCGKSCETCADKQQFQCSGCITADQPNGPDACPIARCCIEKQRSSCDGCQQMDGCAHYASREKVAAERKLEWEHQKYLERVNQDRLNEKKGKVGNLAKWLMVLFALNLCGIVSRIVFDFFSLEDAPVMYFIGLGINILIALITGYAYNRLGDENQKYEKIAWVCWAQAFGGTAVMLGLIYMPYFSALWVLIALVLLVLSLMTIFWEMRAHSEVLVGVDNRMAEKWDTLRKWTLGLMIADIFLVVAQFIPVLGVLLYLAMALADIVINIVASVYRYQTAKIFKAHQAELGL